MMESTVTDAEVAKAVAAKLLGEFYVGQRVRWILGINDFGTVHSLIGHDGHMAVFWDNDQEVLTVIKENCRPI